MSIENRDLRPGTRLVARYKGEEHTAQVVATEGGIRYRLSDGQEFKSPSSAGSAVMGGTACNGWRFWSIEGEEAAEPKGAAKKRRKRAGARPSQDDAKASGLLSRLDDGRYFCSACAEAFEAPAGVKPLGCPKGHRVTA